MASLIVGSNIERRCETMGRDLQKCHSENNYAQKHIELAVCSTNLQGFNFLTSRVLHSSYLVSLSIVQLDYGVCFLLLHDSKREPWFNL